MYDFLLGIAILLTALASIATIATFISAVLARDPRIKRQLRLATIISFGCVFYFLGTAMFFQQRSSSDLPVLNAEGIINTVSVSAGIGHRTNFTIARADGATFHLNAEVGHRTNFTIARADGATFHLNAEGRSDYFRRGQHVVVTYYGYSGTVIKAHFINAAGAEEGVFQSGSAFGLWPYLIILVGCAIFSFAFKNIAPESVSVTA